MVERDEDGQEETDLLWGAIAGLRSDLAGLSGRVERIVEGSGWGVGRAREVSEAEAWREARRKEIDRLMEERGRRGKGEEVDAEDEVELRDAWLCG